MKKLLSDFWNANKAAFFANEAQKDQLSASNWLSKFVLSISILGIVWMFVTILVASIGFMVNIPITANHLPLSGALSLPAIYLINRSIFIKRAFLNTFLVLGVALSIFTGANKAALSVYDLGYDSQWYHLETIIALEQGWNPFYEKLTPESAPDISTQGILNSYPRALEIVQAVVYKSEGQIEIGKSLNLIIMFMTFCFVLSLLLRLKFHPLISIIGSLLIVSNPVALNQSLNFYIDGSLNNLIICFVSLLMFMWLTKRNYLLFPIAFVLSIIWNTKLTGIIYTGIFYGAFLIFCWYTNHITTLLKSLHSVIMGSIIAVFVFGVNPFITNTLWYGSPFYSDGRDSRAYVYTNAPESLYYMGSLERFVISIFSKTEILRGEGRAHTLKMPFTYTPGEVGISKDDGTTGGFGPLFSAVFIFAIIGAISWLWTKNFDFAKRSSIYLAAVIFLSSALFPVSSYARFIPQLWVFVSLIAIFNLASRNFVKKLVALALIAAMIANNYLIMNEYVPYYIAGTRAVREELASIRTLTEARDISVDFGIFRSNRVRFTQAGILFTEAPIDKCSGVPQRILSNYIPESKIMICYKI